MHPHCARPPGHEIFVTSTEILNTMHSHAARHHAYSYLQMHLDVFALKSSPVPSHVLAIGLAEHGLIRPTTSIPQIHLLK